MEADVTAGRESRGRAYLERADRERADLERRVAVIGMAGRFPGAATVTDFWRNIREGVDAARAMHLGESVRKAAGGARSNGARAHGARRTARGGIRDGMDPQLRLLHACVWQAFEDAGYAPDGELGRVGVYIGGTNDAFATYLSYRFGLQGPSLTLQSSSSSSLVAVHLASRAIVTGECEMAIAGGVSARNGSAPGGCGVVVLKDLPRAMADGDHVYGVILGTTSSNDGRRKLAYGVPSVAGQVDAIRGALDMAGVDGDTIEYVEAHGQGAPLGDAVEIEALTQAFQTPRRQFCALGSITTNIGDLSHAAGIAAFIKAVLAVHHGIRPPSVNHREPNPRIDFSATPFAVATTSRQWRSQPRRACVNVSGAGGTNAHVVLEEAPRGPARSVRERRSQLLVLSANEAPALEQATARLHDVIERTSDMDLGDVAFTLRTGRANLRMRRALLCRDRTDALAALGGRRRDRVWTHVSSPPVRVTFLLQGETSRRPLTDGTLYARQPGFRAAVESCLDMLDALAPREADISHVSLVLGLDSARKTRARRVNPASAALALFIYQYACATLLKNVGVQPSALLGDGVGELVAGCLTGVFHLRDALSLVVTRTELVHALRSGIARIAPTNGDRPTDTAVGAYDRALMAVERQPPLMPLLSIQTARPVGAAQIVEPGYWAASVRGESCLQEGIAVLRQTPPHIVLEIGPDAILDRPVNTPPSAQPGHTLLSLGGDDGDDESRLLASLGQLWTRGVDVVWAGLDARGCRRLSLPSCEPSAS
jgi:phthiocerol/phenolphthiocerol synthesis type-I polyketide synthase E